jgi:hypothetical protein
MFARMRRPTFWHFSIADSGYPIAAAERGGVVVTNLAWMFVLCFAVISKQAEAELRRLGLQRFWRYSRRLFRSVL